MAFVETPRSVSTLFSIFLGAAVKWTPFLAESAEMCQHYFFDFNRQWTQIHTNEEQMTKELNGS